MFEEHPLPRLWPSRLVAAVVRPRHMSQGHFGLQMHVSAGKVRVMSPVPSAIADPWVVDTSSRFGTCEIGSAAKMGVGRSKYRPYPSRERYFSDHAPIFRAPILVPEPIPPVSTRPGGSGSGPVRPVPQPNSAPEEQHIIQIRTLSALFRARIRQIERRVGNGRSPSTSYGDPPERPPPVTRDVWQKRGALGQSPYQPPLLDVGAGICCQPRLISSFAAKICR